MKWIRLNTCAITGPVVNPSHHAMHSAIPCSTLKSFSPNACDCHGMKPSENLQKLSPTRIRFLQLSCVQTLNGIVASLNSLAPSLPHAQSYSKSSVIFQNPSYFSLPSSPIPAQLPKIFSFSFYTHPKPAESAKSSAKNVHSCRGLIFLCLIQEISHRSMATI